MNFLHPTFLFALFAITIPIIIHLFNFRTYKTVYFSNVKFLKDIKQETKSKSTLKHLLVLLMRILAITSLVFAFAQPFIPSNNTQKNKIQNEIGIYIDNSFSTEAESKFGKISEIAKKKAQQIVKAYPENTKFFFLTNDFEQKHQHLVSKEQVKEFIQETKVSPSVKLTSVVINKFSDFFNFDKKKHPKNNRAYIISDFQKISSDFKSLKNNINLNAILIPLKSENTNNIFIDSVWFETPNRPISQTDELNIKITNKSNESYNEMPIKLFLNDTLKATRSYNIGPNNSINTKINFTNNKTGIINGKLEITDFPITYDNTFFFNFDIDKRINILVISNKQKNKYINNVFSSNSEVSITYKNPKSINFDTLNNYNLIISDGISSFSNELTQETYSYISDGGTFICFPNININIQSYNKLFNKLNLNYITGIDTSKIYAGHINYNADILKNVFKKREQNIDMPYILQRLKFSNQTFTDEEIILFSEKNDKLISVANYGSGKIYIFSQAADKKVGNLVIHPLWVALIYNIAFHKNNSQKIFYTIAKDEVINFNKRTDNQDNAIHITNNKLKFDIIPQSFNSEGVKSKIFINNAIKEAGHYIVETDNKQIRGLSFNYDRRESDLSHFTVKDIEQIIKNNSLSNFSVMNEKNELFSEIIKAQSTGKQLWKWFIFFALVFLLSEILIIRFVK